MPGKADHTQFQSIPGIESFIDYVTLHATSTVRYFIDHQNPLAHEIQWSGMT